MITSHKKAIPIAKTKTQSNFFLSLYFNLRVTFLDEPKTKKKQNNNTKKQGLISYLNSIENSKRMICSSQYSSPSTHQALKIKLH